MKSVIESRLFVIKLPEESRLFVIKLPEEARQFVIKLPKKSRLYVRPPEEPPGRRRWWNVRGERTQ